ncbi:MAG: YbhB/YbcL family Raf kinase inhibitor-like protein [Candidatus Omnitrophota bacterium]
MQIISPAFEHQGTIPARYTCDGEDVHPPLEFKDIPGDAQSLVLIVDDPDAPGKTWVHWIVYDLPVIDGIAEDVPPPGKQGGNDFGRADYGGPCPPSGKHRYFFKLYALDAGLNLDEGRSKTDIESVMQDHILAQAELIGTYSRG